MFETFFHILESNLFHLGGWGVFLASVIEEVVAPIPSTIVLLGSGALFLGETAHFYQTLFFTIVIPASLGIMVGSLFVYGLSWYVGELFISKWGWILGFTRDGVLRAQKKISEGSRDELTLFFLRAFPIMPSVIISSASGLLKIPFKTFTIVTFLGTIPRVIILALIGWKAGQAYKVYADTISHFEKQIIIIVMAVFVAFVIVRLIKHMREKTL